MGTPAADMLSVKLLLNSIVSTLGAKFFTTDISNFYLTKPINSKEYFRLKLSDMPEDVVKYYNLKTKSTKDGCIFITIKQRVYGLPQAGILTQELLEERVGKREY